MPPAVFLLWPALQLMYGVSQHRSDKIDHRRRYAGRLLLLLALLLASQPYGWEKGLFYLLFSLLGCALVFVQLRIWRPQWVTPVTLIWLISGAVVVLEELL